MKIRLIGSVLLASLFSLATHAEELRGVGVHAFAGSQPCPFSIGAEANACRRVALADGETGVQIDAAQHRIVLTNGKNYAGKTQIADVFLPATAKDAAGRVVPLVLHAKISKSGNHSLTVSSHGHGPVSGPFSDVTMEPWQIVGATGPGAEKQLLSDKKAVATLASPSLAARVAREFVEVEDSRPKGSSHPDITIKLGLGKLAASVLRSRLVVPNATHPEQLQKTLQSGTWSLEMASLSNSIPLSVTRHELFLYGLDQQPLVQRIRSEGFKKGSRLVVGARDGVGYLSIGDESVAFPEAAQSAQRYMDLSFIGLILAWQQVNPN